MPRADAHPLRTRAISALILAPLVLGAAYLGFPWWHALLAIMSAFMAWEWVAICSRGPLTGAGMATVALAPAVVVVGAIWGVTVAIAVLAAAAGIVFVAARSAGFPGPAWLAIGLGYVGLPCLSLGWLRDMPDGGLETLLWVLILVWTTDTGAYVAGKNIGGPKLAPSISPNKTWAGLGGGAGAAMVAGLGMALVFRSPNPWIVAALSGVLAVIEQGGDLFESGFKRRFGVKDSSNLIPGHGGVLDRVDGLLAVAVAVAGLSWAVGHTILEGAGR